MIPNKVRAVTELVLQRFVGVLQDPPPPTLQGRQRFCLTLMQKVKSAGAPYSFRPFTTVYTFRSSRSATSCRCRGSWSPNARSRTNVKTVERTLRSSGKLREFSDLGRAFGGAVESRASEEEINFLPGFPAGFFDVQEALDLRTRPGPQQVLWSKRYFLISRPKCKVTRFFWTGTRGRRTHLDSLFLKLEYDLVNILHYSEEIRCSGPQTEDEQTGSGCGTAGSW